MKTLVQSKLKKFKYHIALVAITASLFAPTLNYPFVWDDKELIVNNPALHNIDTLKDSLSRNYLHAITNDNRDIPFYRPINTAILYFEYQLFGTNVRGYRIFQYLLHCITVLLVFIAFKRILHWFLHPAESESDHSQEGGIPFASAAAALLFTTTPYCIDSVLFISNLGDIIVLPCLIATIGAHARWTESGKVKYLAAIIFFTIIAIFSKETGVLIPVFLLFTLISRRFRNRKSLLSLAVSVVVLGIYIAIRAKVLQGSMDIHLQTAVIRFPADFFTALFLSIFPCSLSLITSMSVYAGAPYFWLLFPLLILIAVKLRVSSVIAAGLVFWSVAVAPSLLLLQTSGEFASRYLYIPSVGLALAGAFLLLKYPKYSKFFFAGIVLTFALLSFIRIQAWKSELSLWQAEYQINPNHPHTVFNTGFAYENQGNYSKALALYLKAHDKAKKRRLAPIQAIALERIASVLLHKYNDPERAKRNLKLSVAVFPTFSAWYSLGLIYAEQDRNYAAALSAFKSAEKLKSNSFPICLAIAGALGGLKRFEEARAYLDLAERLGSYSEEQKREAKQRRNEILEYETHLGSSNNK
ncbi:MAG: glycosyltransferase family 39 protein [Deltaproteobacteria bacterium]|nr:glycosyltransferase family 39 protein [Deltaproteobacteria bacterium]